MNCRSALLVIEDAENRAADDVQAAMRHVCTCPNLECDARDFVEADALLRMNPHLLIDHLAPDPSFDDLTFDESPADQERHAHEVEKASALCLARLRKEGVLPPETVSRSAPDSRPTNVQADVWRVPVGAPTRRTLGPLLSLKLIPIAAAVLLAIGLGHRLLCSPPSPPRSSVVNSAQTNLQGGPRRLGGNSPAQTPDSTSWQESPPPSPPVAVSKRGSRITFATPQMCSTVLSFDFAGIGADGGEFCVEAKVSAASNCGRLSATALKIRPIETCLHIAASSHNAETRTFALLAEQPMPAACAVEVSLTGREMLVESQPRSFKYNESVLMVCSDAAGDVLRPSGRNGSAVFYVYNDGNDAAELVLRSVPDAHVACPNGTTRADLAQCYFTLDHHDDALLRLALRDDPDVCGATVVVTDRSTSLSFASTLVDQATCFPRTVAECDVVQNFLGVPICSRTTPVLYNGKEIPSVILPGNGESGWIIGFEKGSVPYKDGGVWRTMVPGGAATWVGRAKVDKRGRDAVGVVVGNAVGEGVVQNLFNVLGTHVVILPWAWLTVHWDGGEGFEGHYSVHGLDGWEWAGGKFGPGGQWSATRLCCDGHGVCSLCGPSQVAWGGLNWGGWTCGGDPWRCSYRGSSNDKPGGDEGAPP